MLDFVSLFLLFMNKNTLVFSLLALLISATFSCRKDSRDITPPEILIFAPVSSASHQIPYSVTIDAEVSDETQIQSVSVQVVDANMTSIGVGATINVPSNSFRFTETLLIDNVNLSTGTYYVKIKVSDGTNEKTRYAQLNLIEIPLQLKEILIAETPTSSVVEINRLNGTVFENFLSVNNSFNGMEISDRFQQIAIAGSWGDPLMVYNTSSLLLNYSLPGSTLYPTEFFNQIYYSANSNRLLTAHNNGYLFGYDQTGGRTFSLYTFANFTVNDVLETDNYMITEIQSTSSRLFVIYYKSTGIIKYSQAFSYSTVRIFDRGNNELMLFVNDGTQGRLLTYDIVSNIFSEPYSLPAATITDVEQASTNSYFLAMNGYLLRYDYNVNNLIYLSTSANPTDIAYEKLTSSVYSAEGNLLKIYNGGNGALINTIATVTMIKAVKLLYNK